MKDARLTIRVPRDLLENAKQYAAENRTTLTRLISDYLRQLAATRDPLADTPIVRRLSRTLSQAVSMNDYRKHLEDRYGRGT